jgi:dynein heavy chain 2
MKVLSENSIVPSNSYINNVNVMPQGFKASDMHAWKQHWNHQLYKALEHQYQMGLEALNENLPEINIDLTYK